MWVEIIVDSHNCCNKGMKNAESSALFSYINMREFLYERERGAKLRDA